MPDQTLFHTCSPLILASTSPRRKEFLSRLGLDFDIIATPVDETPTLGELPEDFALRMAQDKALAVSKHNESSWIIGADTIITLDNRTIMGKPTSRADALTILKQLSGNTHQVMTGMCLCCPEKKVNINFVESTAVTFIDVAEPTLKAYIATGEPFFH